jgi:hypothetical protein
MTRALLVGNLLVLAFIVAWVTLGAKNQTAGGPAFAMTAQEEKVAADLAEAALKGKDLLRGKVYLSKIEVFRDPGDRASPRRAFVTHYRYEDNAALRTIIDLDRRKVLDVEVLADFPTPLAPQEAARAVELASAHPEVKKLLAGSKGITLEALPVHSSIEGEPAYKHRVVNIFFREGGYYLMGAPLVDVDLTTETVLVKDVPAGKDRPHR